jgi:catechol 2,3-dioxygenase-like lactoylglutathione lyase family enzyme
MQIEGLDHLVLTVADVGRTRDFYERVLGMEPVVFGEGRHALAFGAQKINLHEAGREFEPKAGRAYPELGHRASGGKRRRDPRRTREAHGDGRADNVRVLQGPRRESHRGLRPPGGVTSWRQPVCSSTRKTAQHTSRMRIQP